VCQSSCAGHVDEYLSRSARPQRCRW
jgi:hypothetical protein